MNGGQTDSSYARNSCYQEISLRILQPYLEESIGQMKMVPCGRFCIADLGCAAGPNTLHVAQIICRAVQKKYKALGIGMPDLQVFFSDLPCNDFNLLFQSLPLSVPPDGRLQACHYFAAGVAGSFHNRLFPRSSLHFIHSSFSLHWLSRVPPEVENQMSSSWNGDRVYISKEGRVEVAEAYLRQFQEDLKSFLRARAEEVVEGGWMFLFFSGRAGACPRQQGGSGAVGDILELAFKDMVCEGVIERATRDSFNLPFFSPSALEVRELVEEDGSFLVKKMEFLSMDTEMKIQSDVDFGRMVAKQFRAILEVLIASYFGEHVVESLFQRFAERASQNASVLYNSLRQGGGILAIIERACTP
ncbi:hypothetical protein SUGI_0612600 [Cryptomeria japonica]|nr:hypothetical protein SUGI_0612600 [Cryptomeria japonica]